MQNFNLQYPLLDFLLQVLKNEETLLDSTVAPEEIPHCVSAPLLTATKLHLHRSDKNRRKELASLDANVQLHVKAKYKFLIYRRFSPVLLHTLLMSDHMLSMAFFNFFA